MKITWLGHASLRIEIADQILLVDPWLDGNPAFPDGRKSEAVAGATAILLTHGHGDHASEVVALASSGDIPVACIHELSEGLIKPAGAKAIGFGKGGTIALGEVRVTMVNAVHSSSMDFAGTLAPAESEAGFMIAGEGHTIYVSGDTDIMADMEWMGALHDPDIGILCAGGHYTMDMARAAWAAKRYFRFKTVIPVHYRTFPILEQSADTLIEALSEVQVLTPKVMETLTF